MIHRHQYPLLVASSPPTLFALHTYADMASTLSNMRQIVLRHFSPFADTLRTCRSGGRSHLVQPNYGLSRKSDASIGTQYLIVRLSRLRIQRN